jgi:DNA-binding MarR family transcriptional regulator
LNLADELKGIRPRKTLQGRVINNDDPPEIVLPQVNALAQVRDFVAKSQGEFSPMDIALHFGMSRAKVATYLARMNKKGLIRRVGHVFVGPKCARMHLWRKT